MTKPMPAAFLGHGSPMNALEANRFSSAWRAFGASVPTPRAVLAISAHWFIDSTAVTAMAQPRTIHDFYGFPRELFEVQYPAPGDPTLAEEIAEVVKPTEAALDRGEWGLDHGTWSVLVHAFPNADIPVLQLAINAAKDAAYHFDLGARLAPLRERGVLILGSGNVVHNLRALDWKQQDLGFDWAHRFDDAARELMTDRPAELPGLASHPDYRLAVPTTDHYFPLLYLAGLASAAGRSTDVLVDGCTYGSISMTCYTLDADCPTGREEGPAAPIPDPKVIAPEDTNL